MLDIKEILNNKKQGSEKIAKTERQELQRYFYDKLVKDWNKGKLSPQFFGIKTSHLSTKDLYYMKSVCDSEEKRGKNFSQIFWGMLKVK